MNITVLNGSPKGDKSVSLHYILYMQKKIPGIALKVHHVAQRIQRLEKDEEAFAEIIGDVRSADAVIWAFPLYVLLVCAQFKRFIELLFERNAQEAFRGKHTLSLSTSVHFFDHTAQNYLRGICDDLGMRFVADYPAGMYDLLRRRERQRFLSLAGHFLASVRSGAASSPAYAPLVHRPLDYSPAERPPSVATEGKRIVILTDAGPGDGTLSRMVRALQGRFRDPVMVADLNGVDIAGGCLGCITCGYDNQCVYFGKDGFREFYESTVRPADVIVIAGALKDRYLSSRWKLFFDRAFFNTHIPVLDGKQVGFLISGPLAQNENLRQILTAYPECLGANLVGFVTDEARDSGELDARLDQFARDAVRFAAEGYRRPATFLGVGGRKIFRDEIWGPLRFAFLSDHRYYGRHGFYDFPQKAYRMRLRNALMTLLLRIPFTRRKIQKRFTTEMVKPLQHVLRNK
jgi:multimeric flavodoxin WrbA